MAEQLPIESGRNIHNMISLLVGKEARMNGNTPTRKRSQQAILLQTDLTRNQVTSNKERIST